MRDMKGMEHLLDLDYARRTDHRFHALGTPMDPGWGRIGKQFAEDQQYVSRKQPWWTLTDMAWVVCLRKADIIDQPTAAKLLNALQEIMDDNSGGSGEDRLARIFDGDRKLASIVNYGRTLQEPMSRLKLRAKMLDLFGDILQIMQTTHKLASENTDAIMPGYTHLNHAQPITLGHYLLSLFDGLDRGLELFELAYKHVNRNTGGCGSCSGIAWPVDRQLLTELLGLDDLVAPTYDCEAAQDHSLTALYALTNITVLLSRVAMDMNIWGMDEMDMVRTHPAWCGVSSFMPQKCDNGSNFERTRVKAADVIGEMFKCVTQLKGEPNADIQAAYQLPERALLGMVHARQCIGWMDAMLGSIFPQKERMLKIARSGYGCATELVVHLVTKHDIGGRHAHGIVATMVRNARLQGLKAYECTGEMLDEAAEFLGDKPIGVDTDTVRKCLDPEEFVKTHVHIGGTAPEETKRLLGIRSKSLADAQCRHEERRARIASGEELFRNEIKAICGTEVKELRLS